MSPGHAQGVKRWTKKLGTDGVAELYIWALILYSFGTSCINLDNEKPHEPNIRDRPAYTKD